MMIIRYLLIFAPLAVLAWAMSFNPAAVFVISFLGLIPLASLLGEATEVLALHTGPKVGSLLNATFGTAVELILLFALLRSGQITIVKASIAGSILASLILVVGLSQILGGLRNGIQRFDKEGGGMAMAMMTMAVAGLALPTFLGFIHQIQLGKSISVEFEDASLDYLSEGIAIILLVLYGLLIIFQFRNYKYTKKDIKEEIEVQDAQKWTVRSSIGILIATTLAVAIVSEILSQTVEPFGESIGLSALFMGVIIIPIAGNVSEILVGVRTARKNKLDLSLSLASNSAMQIALFVAPLLALVSRFFGQEMTLYFRPSEVFALMLAVFASIVIASDEVSNWLEGAQFLSLYLIIALWFYFLI